MLDRQKPTATGMDGLPVWFLRVSAPIVTAPLAALFNHSISVGVVPQQWKNAIITTVPKIPILIVASDYRPISVTPVLSRLVERHLAFQPQVLILQINMPLDLLVRLLLLLSLFIIQCVPSNQFVQVFVLDFSKAFDSISQLLLNCRLYPYLMRFIIGSLIFY